MCWLDWQTFPNQSLCLAINLGPGEELQIHHTPFQFCGSVNPEKLSGDLLLMVTRGRKQITLIPLGWQPFNPLTWNG